MMRNIISHQISQFKILNTIFKYSIYKGGGYMNLAKKLMKEVFDTTTLTFQDFQQKLREAGEKLNIRRWVWVSSMSEEEFKNFLEENVEWGRILKFENGKVTIMPPKSSKIDAEQ